MFEETGINMKGVKEQAFADRIKELEEQLAQYF